jgi:DNA end-binding protein Ku
VCSLDGEEVSYENIVKGYEIAPNQYVIIDPNELSAIDPKATHSIDIEEFVDLDQIDPLYFEHAYYLVPDKRAEKPYALLVEAMRRSNKVAIARMVLRTKQYLVALRAVDDAIVLETLYYADEVIDPDELDGIPHDVDVSDRELKIARQLIESLATEFEPEQYRDEYRERVLDLIEKKAEGQEVVLQPQTEEPAQVVDLMAALEASLAAVKDAKDDKPSKPAKKK